LLQLINVWPDGHFVPDFRMCKERSVP
jgi:hypothetical protein